MFANKHVCLLLIFIGPMRSEASFIKHYKQCVFADSEGMQKDVLRRLFRKEEGPSGITEE